MEFIKYIIDISLSDWGSWASLLGLIITFATYSGVSKLKNKYLFSSSIDIHIKKINDISSEMTALIATYNNSQEQFEEYLALANVELRVMQKGASEDLLKDIKNARKQIWQYKTSLIFWVKKNEKTARQIKTSLSVVAAELDHRKKSILVGN